MSSVYLYSHSWVSQLTQEQTVMRTMRSSLKAEAPSRYLTSTCCFQLAPVMTVARFHTQYQLSMAAINGTLVITLFIFYREVSHPNLIEIKSIRSEAHPECSNIAHVKAVSTKPTKSLVWISAKDQCKNSFILYSYRLWVGPQMRGQAWKNRKT